MLGWLGRRLRPGAERGAAVVEFLVVFVAMVVPIVYAIVIIADAQRALMATSSAAREMGRAYVTGSSPSDAQQRAQLAFEDMMTNYGFDPQDADPDLAGSFGPGAEVRVAVTYHVPVLDIPFLDPLGVGPTINITSHHRTRFDRYRGF